MSKVTGFLQIDRMDRSYKIASDRILNYDEFVIDLPSSDVKRQATRCMDCGIPFCHNGCPVNNQIPDWNNLVYAKDMKKAIINLHSTNNFPEFTGRICPAPCEASCTLNIQDNPVTIKTIEYTIIEKAFKNGWVKPYISKFKTGKKVAIIGAGPAGMAAAQQLARAGHDVHLYEKNAKVGGLLRYGIPDFKLNKEVIDRRVAQMQEEGVKFFCNSELGKDILMAELEKKYDAILLSIGSEKPRDVPAPGRDLEGIHFAMDFLTQQNRRVSGEENADIEPILATGKHVVVIGGGDTGSDCIGTSVRQGALSVTQLEIMPKPPEMEDKALSWPHWPNRLRTSSSHEEGAERMFSIKTNEFIGEEGVVESIKCCKVDEKFQDIPNSEFDLRADLVLLAIGFVHPIVENFAKTANLQLDERSNIKASDTDYKTSKDKIFVAGDARRGQSLVVWAIREGRQAASSIDEYLMGSTNLPR